MTKRRERLKRAIIGGIIGLALGFCFMLLVYGFRVVDALIGMLWLIPLPLIGIYAASREKPNQSNQSDQ
jgi:preprotein translocase subunit SecD